MATLRTRSSKGSALTHAELDANFKRTVTQKTTTYSVIVSDNRSIIEGNHATTAFTITLGDAATMAAAETGDFEVTITNINAAIVTVAPAGANTIDGAATNLTLGKNASVTLQVISAQTGYKSISSLSGDITPTIFTPTVNVDTGSVTLTAGFDSLAHIKTGRIVHIQGKLTFTSVSSPTGRLQITDLPFTVSNLTDGAGEANCPVWGKSWDTALAGQLTARFAEGGTTLQFLDIDTAGTETEIGAKIASGTEIFIAGQYITD